MIENYFKLLDLEAKYIIDQSQLKKKYLAKQIQFHPDRALGSDQKRLFLEQSIKLNQAEKILKDDYQRAEYMLKLLGIEFDDKTLRNAMSQDYFEEILEINEMIENSNDLNLLQKIENEQLTEKMGIILKLDKYFEASDATKALDLTIRLKYLTNLVKNIKLRIKHADSRDL